MNLLDYIKLIKPNELEILAIKCSTSAGHLKQIAYKNRRANPSMAINIDKHTNGAVSFWELRPDVDWHYVKEKVTA